MSRQILGFAFWILLSFSAAWVGSRFMPGEWYSNLTKPSWNPPAAVFGPVWTLLYLLMGISAGLVWRRAGFTGETLAMGLFCFQLILNALWSYLFFGLHRPDLAFFDILALWLAIVVTLVLFWRISMPAGVLLLPYLAWVTFAAVLNLQLWRLNA